MALSDTYQLTVEYNSLGKSWFSKYLYVETQAETADEQVTDGIGQRWTAAIKGKLLDILSIEVVIGGITVIPITGPDKYVYREVYTPTVGNRIGEHMPGSCGMRVNLSGTHQGRPSRGAQIISGLSEADVDNGQLNATFSSTQVKAYLDELMTTLVPGAPWTGNWRIGFMSRANATPGQPLVAWPGNPVVATAASVSPWLQTLRSRQTTHEALVPI